MKKNPKEERKKTMTKPFTKQRKTLLDISQFVSQDILPQIHEKFETLRDLHRDVVENMEHNSDESSPHYHSLGELYHDIDNLMGILRPIYESNKNNQLEAYENQLQVQIGESANEGRNTVEEEQTEIDNYPVRNPQFMRDMGQALQEFVKKSNEKKEN